MSILGAIGGLVGNIFGARSAAKTAEQQMRMQEHFAKNSVRWRVADAKRAGVGTLAALGMQPISYSPVSVGGQDWGSVGQNIGNSLDSVTSDQEKNSEFTQTMQQLQVQRLALENDVIANQAIASRAALRTQPGIGPGVPSTEGPGSKPANPITIFGHDITQDRRFSDAEEIQRRYGEPAEWPYAPLVMGADAVATARDAVGFHRQKTPISDAIYRWWRNRPARNAAQHGIYQRRWSDHGYW